MALTAVLVESTPYRLRYLITSSTAAGLIVTIPNVAGVTPDLRTDLATAPSGPLREIIRAGVDGIGTVAAGALTLAQARDIMNSDGSGASVGNDLVSRAVLTLTPRVNAVASWATDVSVLAFNPQIVVTIGVALVADCYLDIHMRHSYDL